MIRVGLYDYKSKRQAQTPGYINLLVHVGGPFSPYTLKDEKGRIMEMLYQSQKVYPRVYPQDQKLHMYTDEKGWTHPGETHFKDGLIYPEYWAWREKGLNCPFAVRRMNGYKGHKECICSLRELRPEEDRKALEGAGRQVIQDSTGNAYVVCNLVQARKEIYFYNYSRLVKMQPEFKDLQAQVKSGVKLQINEVDAPQYRPEYPYNLVVNGSIEVNEVNVKALLDNPSQPWGHSLALAVTLLGKEEWIS